MTKPVTPNAFNTPGLFKIDMLSFKKSASGTVGGKVRSANTNGNAPLWLTQRTPRGTRKPNEKT